MNKKGRTQRGITLIALIVTIIVMLILVGVTISMAVNGGLFNYAGKAAKETNDAIKAEGTLGSGLVNVNGKGDQDINAIVDRYVNGTATKTPITASTMQSNLKSYLGKTIAYEVEYADASTYGNGEWEIFYADGEHIYIITRGNLAGGGFNTDEYNGTSDFTAESLQTKYKAIAAGLFNKTYDPKSVGSELKYTVTWEHAGPGGNCMQVTQYLLDSTVERWTALLDDEYAEWAIGTPTLELFVNSYNAYYPDNAVTLTTKEIGGYENPLLETNSVPSGTYLHHSTDTHYWFAAPRLTSSVAYQDMFAINGGTSVSDNEFCKDYIGLRPVVCLSSDVQLTWDAETSAYTISSAS